VVTASRELVCIRPATYESETEGELLASLFRTRTGELENTVFAVLSPDGRTKLARTGRGPRMVFGTAAEMAAFLESVAAGYPAGDSDPADAPLPAFTDLRLALNVAACDSSLLVVVASEEEATRRALERRLAPLAWSDALVGKLRYVTIEDLRALEVLADAPSSAGVAVVRPDAYGRTGQVVAFVGASGSERGLENALRTALAAHSATEKDAREHVRAGKHAGIGWTSKLPVTDSRAVRR
jgi:hypothetical protein